MHLDKLLYEFILDEIFSTLCGKKGYKVWHWTGLYRSLTYGDFRHIYFDLKLMFLIFTCVPICYSFFGILC